MESDIPSLSTINTTKMRATTPLSTIRTIPIVVVAISCRWRAEQMRKEGKESGYVDFELLNKYQEKDMRHKSGAF